MKVGDIVTVHDGSYYTDWFVISGFENTGGDLIASLSCLDGELFYGFKPEYLRKVPASAIIIRVQKIIYELDTLTKSLEEENK